MQHSTFGHGHPAEGLAPKGEGIYGPYRPVIAGGYQAHLSAATLDELWSNWIPSCREHGLSEATIRYRISTCRDQRIKAQLTERYLQDFAPESRAYIESLIERAQPA